MTRIIAGFAGSITLRTPGAGTRPTSDRVREAIFSALDSRALLEGARVLDLYAGSGALGLEAASRGAAVVRLVERSLPATNTCRINAAAVLKQAPRDARPQIEVTGQPVQAFLASNTEQWDIVFIDPPYDVSELEVMHDLELLVPRLTQDAVVLIERGVRSPQPAWPVGLELDRRKDYGDTTLWWAAPLPLVE